MVAPVLTPAGYATSLQDWTGQGCGSGDRKQSVVGGARPGLGGMIQVLARKRVGSSHLKTKSPNLRDGRGGSRVGREEDNRVWLRWELKSLEGPAPVRLRGLECQA